MDSALTDPELRLEGLKMGEFTWSLAFDLKSNGRTIKECQWRALFWRGGKSWSVRSPHHMESFFFRSNRLAPFAYISGLGTDVAGLP